MIFPSPTPINYDLNSIIYQKEELIDQFSESNLYMNGGFSDEFFHFHSLSEDEGKSISDFNSNENKSQKKTADKTINSKNLDVNQKLEFGNEKDNIQKPIISSKDNENIHNFKFIPLLEIKRIYGKKLNKDNNVNLLDDILVGGEITKSIENNLEKKSQIKGKNENKAVRKEKNLVGLKRQRQSQEILEILLENGEIDNRKKMGRKAKNCTEISKHNKYSEDNQIYCFQTHFYNWALNVINSIIKKKEIDFNLLKLDHQIIKNINREDNLKFLQMSVSEFFSQNISPNYSKYFKNYGVFNSKSNENNIKELLRINDAKLNNILKLSLQDFLDIYRYKENNSDLMDIIGNEFSSINEFLVKIYEKEPKKSKEDVDKAKDYVSSLLVMIYNYEAWFFFKKPRQRRNKIGNKIGNKIE